MARYRARAAFSCARPASRHGGMLVGPTVSQGSYIIVRDDHILMAGRTFSRDDAEAICDALEDATGYGFEEAALGDDAEAA